MEASTGKSAAQAFAFGGFRLIPARQLLLRDGVPVPLGARALDLLTALVQRGGELVSKDELMAAAWPDVFVHDSNLKVNMWSLRRALGDTQKQPLYIATVAGRGYRFVADVQIGIADPVDPSIAAKVATMCGLPPQRDIVGRENEIAQLLAELRVKTHVTVVGPGGVGKTSVAVAAALAFEADFPDGVCFLDLSTFDDPTFLPAALATALGLRGNPGDMFAAVIDVLRQRRVLVLLDSCEHVLPGAAIFARRLAADKGQSKLLATSREPLGTQAEHVVRLNPLAFPNAGAGLTVAKAIRFPALELFARRASEWAGYQLVDDDCAAVAQICRALDGLPLAIELAAAKVEFHKPQDLLAMLGEHLRFRHQRAVGAPPRQETLLATIDWSFKLLPRSEAIILRLVSVFADAFEQDDAVAVAAAAGLTPVDVAAGLGGLVAKSLLAADVNGPELRYRLLDSTRAYAAERLAEETIAVHARRCHAERILTVFEQSEGEWDWREPNDWTRRYLGRLADLRTALSWAFGAGGEPVLGIRLTVAALPLWWEASLLSEAQARAEAALKLAQTIPCDDLLRTKLACARAWSMLYARKLVPESEQAWLDAIAFAERAGSLAYRLRALVGFSLYLIFTGRVARAIKPLEKIGALSERHQDWSAAPEGERLLALAKAYMGQLRESRSVLDRLAAAYARPDGRSRVAGLQVDRYIGIRNYLSFVAWLTGHPDYAAATARDAVGAAGTLGHLLSQSAVLGLAALPVSLLSGDTDALERYTAQLQSILEQESIAIWIPVRRFFAATLQDLRGVRGAVCEMQESIDALIEGRFLRRICLYLGILADALARQGKLEEARDTIATALRYQVQQDERWCRPELLRIEASIILRAGQRAPAERLLQRALDEARAIGAASFELRIASDLSALYIDTDRCGDALRVLGPVYRGFTEGFATKDLVAAAQLLRRADAEAA